MRRQKFMVLLPSEIDRMPMVCIRDGRPTERCYTSTFREPRTLWRPWRWVLGVPGWLISLYYRETRLVQIPVCDRCGRLYQAGRAVLWALALLPPLLSLVLLMPPDVGDALMKVPGPWFFLALGIGSPVLFPLLLWWLWRRPVYGILDGPRLRLRRVSDEFREAFWLSAGNEKRAPAFAWMDVADGGPVPMEDLFPVTGSPPRRPVRRRLRRLTVLLVAVMYLAVPYLAVESSADESPPAPKEGIGVLRLGDLPTRFEDKRESPLRLLLGVCGVERVLPEREITTKGQVFATAGDRELAFQYLVLAAPGEADRVYRRLVAATRACIPIRDEFVRPVITPAAGPAVGDRSSWWQNTAAVTVGSPRYDATSPRWILLVRRGDTISEFDAQSKDQVLKMARTAVRP